MSSLSGPIRGLLKHGLEPLSWLLGRVMHLSDRVLFGVHNWLSDFSAWAGGGGPAALILIAAATLLIILLEYVGITAAGLRAVPRALSRWTSRFSLLRRRLPSMDIPDLRPLMHRVDLRVVVRRLLLSVRGRRRSTDFTRLKQLNEEPVLIWGQPIALDIDVERIHNALAGRAVDPPLTEREHVTVRRIRMAERVRRAAAGHSVYPPLTEAEKSLSTMLSQSGSLRASGASCSTDAPGPARHRHVPRDST
jgi:hypothetical protein